MACKACEERRKKLAALAKLTLKRVLPLKKSKPKGKN